MEDKNLATPTSLDADSKSLEEETQTLSTNSTEDVKDSIEPSDEETTNSSKTEDIWNKKESIEDLENSLFNKEPSEESEQSNVEDTNQELESNTDDNIGSKSVIIDRPLKYRGNEIWVKNQDEAIELMQKGMDYSFKMNKIKPHRQVIDDNGLSTEDVQALVDAKNGNKQALNYLAKNFGIEQEQSNDFGSDLFDDGETSQQEEYKPQVEQEDPVTEMYTELSNKDPELAGKVAKIYEDLDPTFKQEVYTPQVFGAFINTVQTGTFEKVLPYAIKTKAINPSLSWIQAYDYATKELQDNGDLTTRQVSEPDETVKPKQTKTKPKPKSIKKSYEEIWNEKQSIEDLEKELFGSLI